MSYLLRPQGNSQLLRCMLGKTYVGPEGAWSAYEIVSGSKFGNRMQLKISKTK